MNGDKEKQVTDQTGEKKFRGILYLFSNNWKMKMLSVVFALFFWIFVLSTDNTVTRERTVEIPLTILGEEQLDDNTGLVVATNRSEIPETVTVTVAASVADVLKVDASTVRATINLSNVAAAGERTMQIAVQPDDDTWKVKDVEPSSVKLAFDKKATVEVPIQVIVDGELSAGYWRGTPTVTPATISLTGSESEIEKVARVVCRVDLTEQTLPIDRAVNLEALDEEDNVIDDANFVDALPRGILTLPIYPQKTVPIDTNPALISNEFVAEGYTLEGLRPSLSEVMIAAPQEVLDSIQSISISIPRQPGETEENTRSFSTTVSLQMPEGVVWSNYSEVSVWIQIGEVRSTLVFDDFQIRTRGEGEGLRANIIQSNQTAQITLAGPKALLDEIRRSDVNAYIDVSNYGTGMRTLPVEVELPEEYANQIDVSVLPSERSVNIVEEE